MLKKIVLGKTGMEVTELVFGALPMGPLQKSLPLEEQVKVTEYALYSGINFIDTAQLYRTYEPIGQAIKNTGIRPIIASKSGVSSYRDMEDAVYQALQKMGIDYIDIFHIHGSSADENLFKDREGALNCLFDLKEKGIIKAVGIATHRVKVVNIAANINEIDIIFPLFNKWGLGILGGTPSDMNNAIKKAKLMGKGVYIMKALGGGTFIDKYVEGMNFVRKFTESPVAVGMISKEEIDYNCSFFKGETDKEPDSIKAKKGFQVLSQLCIGCENCIKRCPNTAIIFIDKKAWIDREKCLRCGYCVPECPKFAIRVI